VDKGFGNHSLYLDDFDLIISTTGQSNRVDYRSIGSLNRGFLTWITLGGVELKINSSDNPLGEPAVVASYDQVQGRYIAISHSLSNLDLRGTKKLTFRIAAKNDSKIMVYLEKKSPGAIAGSRYSFLLSVPGRSRPAQQQIALADLRPDVSGPRDVDEKLNPGELKSISFVDITGAVSPPPKKNTLWISSIQPQ
jgi:hypothetical protein